MDTRPDSTATPAPKSKPKLPDSWIDTRPDSTATPSLKPKPKLPDSWIDTRPEPATATPNPERTSRSPSPERTDTSTPLAEAHRPRRRKKSRPPVPMLLDPAGPGPWVPAILSIVCLVVPRLSGLVVPVAVFGVLWGVAATAVARSVRRSRSRPALAAGVSALALLVVGFPSLVDAFRPRGPERTVNTADLMRQNWNDASKGVVRQGNVSIHVVNIVSATVPAPPAARKATTKTTALERTSSGPIPVLVIRLRADRDVPEPGAVWKDRNSVTLTDDAGRPFTIRATPIGISPAGPNEALFTFDAPPRIRKFLRLEIPGPAVGVGDSFRFRIPTEMIGG